MTLDRDHALVYAWHKMLTKTNSPYTMDDVPDIYNLREVVQEWLNEEANS